jgi:hypothetical protein
MSFRRIPEKINNGRPNFRDVLSNRVLQDIETVFNQKQKHSEKLGGAANAENCVLVNLAHANGGIDSFGRIGQSKQ